MLWVLIGVDLISLAGSFCILLCLRESKSYLENRYAKK